MPRAVAILSLALLATAAPARAQDRPRFQVAIGMGASYDHTVATPTAPARDVRIPAYLFSGGFGDGPLGVDLRVFASGAAGGTQFSRTGGEVVLVLRPLAWVMHGDRYRDRLLRGLALSAGPAHEQASKGLRASGRTGAVVGVHVDVPLLPAAAHKDLRLRIAARRLWAGETTIGDITVEDSDVDLFGMLALVF